MPDDTDEAADIPGHIVQGLLRERDEARAMNGYDEIHRLRAVVIDLSRERDEARAIARRYRNTHRDCAAHRGKRCATCIAFDALPWAKDAKE